MERRWAESWDTLAREQGDAPPAPAGSSQISSPPASGPTPETGVRDTAAGEIPSSQPPSAAADCQESRAETAAAAAERQPLARCSDYLIGCCPACFGDNVFGRTLDEGCDIHVAGDANFSQRHDFKAGDSPPYRYRGVFQLNPARIREMEARLVEAGKRPTGTYRGGVPADDLDACQDSHTAGTGSKKKVLGDKYDDTGVFALICHHGSPLCFINISEGGEGQKYMLASLDWLRGQLPPAATLAAYYDIGCFTDRTRQRYNIFPADFSDRLVFVTSAMHAYAHQWTCQLVYSPRMKRGMGLTDGEGVERLWSALRMLISKLRSVSRRRRLVLLDRQMQRISRRRRYKLGRLLRKRRKDAREKSALACKVLIETGHSLEYLQDQWDLQRTAELSIRSRELIHSTRRRC
ncbi:hypothetical protein AURDEDRAFT_70958 [Auricularia subglabra TFB-10046 SS5]|nr:hypothetical protein AURDEDRAFT_70958 [Auricularia subglabra TFB-10046 SS5]